MSVWQDKATFGRFLDQAVNNGNLDVVDEIFHPEFVGYFPDSQEPAKGVAHCKQWVAKIRDAFADINSLIEGGWLISEVGSHEVGKGTVVERMAAFVVLRGTHTGSFAKIAPSGRRVTWGEVHLLTFDKGQVVQDIVVRDTLSLLKQIGVTSLSDVQLPVIVPPILI